MQRRDFLQGDKLHKLPKSDFCCVCVCLGGGGGGGGGVGGGGRETRISQNVVC